MEGVSSITGGFPPRPCALWFLANITRCYFPLIINLLTREKDKRKVGGRTTVYSYSNVCENFNVATNG